MTTHLHGVPLNKWIGRMMKSAHNNRVSGKARHTVKVIGFDPKNATALVHPSGHKGTEVTSLEHLIPWWSRNDDLRQKYGGKGKDAQFMQEAFDECLDAVLYKPKPPETSLEESDRQIWEARQQQRIKPTIHEKAPTPSLPEEVSHSSPQRQSNSESKPEPRGCLSDGVTEIGSETAPCHPQARPEGRKEQAMTRTIKQIVINPNASSTWMDDYKALQEAMSMVKAREDAVVQAHLEHAKETVDTFIAALDGMGVSIEWDEPVVDPTYEDRRRDPNPLRTAIRSNTPTRKVPSERDIPEIDLARVRRFRHALVNQMVPGRSYDRAQILKMLGETDGPTTKKIITYTFRGHSKLSYTRGGGPVPGTYFIKA